MSKKINTISDLKPQVRNSNKHTQRGLGLLQDSIQKNGWIGAITVAADGETFDGSARIEVGADAGFDDAIIVRSDGSKPVVHIREDIKTADDPKAKILGVSANRIAEIDFDPDVEVLAELADDGIELGQLYSDDELSELVQSVPDIDFKEYGEEVENEVKYCTCPECGHKFPQ